MNIRKTDRLSKTSRQLIIFHIFIYSKVIELIEIKKIIEVSTKTIMRDLKELQYAGLLNIKFTKKENGYIHIDDNKRCPFSAPILSDNKAKNLHLQKLIRISTIMIELRNFTELHMYENHNKEQETCSSWYKNRFPSLSKRTMQRDFNELNKIGYEIKYDSYERNYIVEFPEGIEGIENNLLL